MYRYLSTFLFLTMLAFPTYSYSVAESMGSNSSQTEEIAKRDNKGKSYKHGRHGHSHHRGKSSWSNYRGYNTYPYYRNNAYFYRGYNTYHPYYYNTYPGYYQDTYDSNPSIYFYWGF